MTAIDPPAPAPDVPQPARGAAAALQRFSERQNPILVRYVRQQLRSRAFLVVYSCLLAFATLFALAIGASAGVRGEGAAASELLGLLIWVWSFAVWVVEPISVFRATAAEREAQTWDLLRLTGMPPGRIVRGLFLASVVQGLVYAAAIAPFLVMAYLLRGIALSDILSALVIVPVSGWCASAGAIFLGCVSKTRGARNAFNAVVAVTTGFLWLASMTIWQQLEALQYFFAFTLDSGLAVALIANFAVVWIGGALVVGAATLRQPTDNRATAPRAYTWLVVLNALLWALAVGGDFTRDAVATAAVFGALFTVALGFFAITEDYVVTPRQARETARMAPWKLPLLFAPGAARGRLCTVALALVIAAAAAWGADSSRAQVPAITAGLIVAHGLIFLALGDALARTAGRARAADPATRRVFVLLFLLAVGFASVLVEASVGSDSGLVAALPFNGIPAAAGGYDLHADVVVFVLAMGGVAAATLTVQAARRTPVLRRV